MGMPVSWTANEICEGRNVGPYDLVKLNDGTEAMVQGVFRHTSFVDQVKVQLWDGRIIEGFESYSVVRRYPN